MSTQNDSITQELITQVNSVTVNSVQKVHHMIAPPVLMQREKEEEEEEGKKG